MWVRLVFLLWKKKSHFYSGMEKAAGSVESLTVSCLLLQLRTHFGSKSSFKTADLNMNEGLKWCFVKKLKPNSNYNSSKKKEFLCL